MLFENGDLKEKYRSLSPNSLRILAWQEDQYVRPHFSNESRKRKMDVLPENDALHSPRSPSPRKRARSSRVDIDGETDSEVSLQGNDAAYGQDAFTAAIALTSPTILEVRNRTQMQQISPTISQSSHTSPTRQTYTRTHSPSKGGLRQRRILLAWTEPKFYSGLPEIRDDENMDGDGSDAEESLGEGQDLQYTIPDLISTLVKEFSESAATRGCIPQQLESAIRKSSHNTELIPEEAFAPRPYRMEDAQMFRSVTAVLRRAQDAYRSHKDEQAWYPVVRAVLDGLAGPSTGSFLTVEESQSQIVCQEFLPLAARVPIGSVKTDHLLQLNKDNAIVAALLGPVFMREPALSLSAFNDPVAARTFTTALVEVKQPGGDYDEGVYQLTVASAAVLARLRWLTKGADMGHELPVLGWVVHGHFWYLHLTYVQHDGSIRILGPLPSGNTATYLGIFRLLRIVTVVKRWIRATYWPYLRDIVEARASVVQREHSTAG